MTLRRIRLELARDHDFPNGSSHHGYDFIAPLDDSGHLDAAEWRKERQRCRVKRFWQGETDRIGHLVHRPGGSWAFDYDVARRDDDEPGYRFATHRFTPGEYVSIREPDGALRTFHIRSVVDLD